MWAVVIGLLIVVAVVAFTSDRYGPGGVEAVLVVCLLAIDLVMIGSLLAVAGAENCDSDGRWQCNRAVTLLLIIAIPAVTFAIGYLLVRAGEREN